MSGADPISCSALASLLRRESAALRAAPAGETLEVQLRAIEELAGQLQAFATDITTVAAAFSALGPQGDALSSAHNSATLQRARTLRGLAHSRLRSCAQRTTLELRAVSG